MAASPGSGQTTWRRSLPAHFDPLPERRRQRGFLYGRRKGPKLSAHQSALVESLLPRLKLDLRAAIDPKNYFGAPVDDVWLEIGFGAGEHLLWQAQHHGNVGVIGAEPYQAGIAKLLSKLSSLAHPPLEGRWNTELPRNLRIYEGDAHDVIEALPDASLGRVFLLFPDPWPKTRHHKRRFIQTEMLDQFARVMKCGAEIRFASDDRDYVEWVLERILLHSGFEWMAARSDDWRTRPLDWPSTRYEQKALHGVPVFLRFRRPMVNRPVVLHSGVPKRT
jgi:tRNA (guanine-N7-)-methyltransferase